jgi:Lon protease-like protein
MSFEPRYLTMVDDSLSSPYRAIGMIQPLHEQDDHTTPPLQNVGCLGRLTGFQETDGDRCLITLTGLIRFDIADELEVTTPYRQITPSYDRFTSDLAPAEDSDQINRTRLLELLRQYLDANNMNADWKMINATGGEELVNFLSMISPFGLREKQALLEAETCVKRTEVLIALVEMVLSETSQGPTPVH